MPAPFDIVLYEPEIPPNTGNIIRLCANMGAPLHLIHPLGFSLDAKQLRRAGLDYQEWMTLEEHDSLERFQQKYPHKRLIACTTHATQMHTAVDYQTEDVLLFGPETRGLPQQLLETLPPEQCIRVPMLPNSRSLNLSNAVAIIAYEAWRQFNWRDPASQQQLT